MLIQKIFAVFVVISLSAACTSDYATFDLPENTLPPSIPPPAKPMEVAGTWFSRVENNAVNCGVGEYVDAKAVAISQDLDDISMLTSSGDRFTGKVSGDIVEWTGSYPQWNGMTDYTSASLVFSGDSGAGNATWTWTDGSDSCNGTMAISFGRAVTVESGSNSRPDIADQFEFVDRAAFFTGSLGEGGDVFDYFSFTAPENATLQVELSHFDTGTTNLDVLLFDENLQEIARADSQNSFDMLDAPVSAGLRYYVRVEAASITGPDTYNLSLDIN